jgi:hypothetical protein
MKNIRCCVVCVVVLFAGLCAGVLVSGVKAGDKAQKSSLTGLRGVHVVLERIDPQLNTAILETRSVERDIEVTLAAAGINVLDKDEMLQTPGMPYLYINLNTAKSGIVYAYHIQIELKQGAYLERDPNIFVTATTWSGNGLTGMVAMSEVDTMRNRLDDSVAEFIRAYLSANQPEAKK